MVKNKKKGAIQEATVVIPASRVPDAGMLQFWDDLATFEGVGKIIFVANGEKRCDIRDILNRYFSVAKSVETVSTEIGSAPHARNTGLEKTDSPYVHFLDDDDQVRPDFYRQTIAILEQEDVVGVAVSADVCVDGNPDNSYRVSRSDRKIGLQALMVDNYLGPTSGVILKTNAVKSVRGFDETMPARQDYDLWLRLGKVGDFRTCSEPLLVWTENRTRPSIRNSTSTGRHLIAIEKLTERKRELGWGKLPGSFRRRGTANHYKYLAVMSQLNDGKKPWGYILRSIAAYPQGKSILMLMPENVSLFARRTLSEVRKKARNGSQYSKGERRLASALARFPRAKKALKYAYQGTFYLLSARKSSKLNVFSGELSAVLVPGSERTETFFGYYDRNPENNKGLLVVHTLEAGKCRVHVVGRDGKIVATYPTNAWNYQQGALPFWVDDETIIFNDCKDGKIQTVVHDLSSKQKKVFAGSFQTYSKESGLIASININLINRLRPEYGFVGVDPLFKNDEELLAFRSLSAPDSDAVFVTVFDMNLATGLQLPVGKTKINHVVFSPNGKRVTFLLRYFEDMIKHTIQVIYDFKDGTYKIVNCGNVVSHYCWVDEDAIAIWGETKDGVRGYFLSDMAGDVREISVISGGFSNGDGHPTLVPNTEYLISDTYPDKAGLSHLYRFSLQSGTEKELASFFQPFRFRGSKRIDLHPRYSPVSGKIYIDSGHSGQRGAYKLEMPVERFVEGQD